MTESLEVRALTLEQERTANRARAAIRDIQDELSRLEQDPSRADRARQVVAHAGDLVQAATKLETLIQFGHLA